MLKKKNTLVIIGNGFDRWLNLDTSYSSFQKYYEEHRDEILGKLGIGKIQVFDNSGSFIEFSDELAEDRLALLKKYGII